MRTEKTHPLTIWRKEHGVAMQVLAERVECAQSFLSQIENGKRNPSLKTAAKLKRETGLPIESFVEAAQ